MTTWEEIRDEVAGALADGKPLEDVIAKLEQRKNEMAKANLIAVFEELKKPKPMTNEEWFCSLDTEDKAREISDMTAQGYWSEELVEKWLKEEHK